ncbi:MAG: hypothetical protein P1V51_04950 [Deltaproteobacteria bacterium]|nr:hypothetical protein [Deltaproteobacteria bacterium]
MDPKLRAYFAEIGRKGGRKSRRKMDPQTARDMVKVREARRAFRRFHARCFWSHDPDHVITLAEVPWVADQLMRHGGREGWEIGARLCR